MATTRIVLALWLFALTISVAHACGLDEAFHVAYPAAVAAAGHGSQHHHALPACDQFCADETVLLGKLSAVEDSPAGAAAVTALPQAHASLVFEARGADRALPPVGPPTLAINTLFVRLAL